MLVIFSMFFSNCHTPCSVHLGDLLLPDSVLTLTCSVGRTSVAVSPSRYVRDRRARSYTLKSRIIVISMTMILPLPGVGFRITLI